MAGDLDDMQERMVYDDNTDRLTVVHSQDVTPYLNHNAALRETRSEHQKYKGSFVRAASVPMVVIEMMRNGQCCADGKRYNLLSPDNKERRRALMHVQSEHKGLLTVRGRPFAKVRPKWQ